MSKGGVPDPAAGGQEGKGEKHFRGSGWRTPLGAPGAWTEVRRGSAHLEEAQGSSPHFLPGRDDHSLSQGRKGFQHRHPPLAMPPTPTHPHGSQPPHAGCHQAPPGHAIFLPFFCHYFLIPLFFLDFTPLPSPLALGFQATTKEVKESLGKQWSQLSDKKRLKWIHKALEQRKEYEVGSSLTRSPPHSSRHSLRAALHPGPAWPLPIASVGVQAGPGRSLVRLSPASPAVCGAGSRIPGHRID